MKINILNIFLVLLMIINCIYGQPIQEGEEEEDSINANQPENQVTTTKKSTKYDTTTTKKTSSHATTTKKVKTITVQESILVTVYVTPTPEPAPSESMPINVSSDSVLQAGTNERTDTYSKSDSKGIDTDDSDNNVNNNSANENSSNDNSADVKGKANYGNSNPSSTSSQVTYNNSTLTSTVENTTSNTNSNSNNRTVLVFGITFVALSLLGGGIFIVNIIKLKKQGKKAEESFYRIMFKRHDKLRRKEIIID